MQQSILLLFATLAGIIVCVFVFVFLSSRSDEQSDDGMTNVLQKRIWFILILFVSLGIIAAMTLPKSPYFLFKNEQPVEVIHVAAGQFYFMMAHQPIDPEAPESEATIELPANQLVEFRVASFDVNHDFAIYDDKFKVVTQTQAMPGYINSLRWKFKPGNYTIFCLEYCGAGHQLMRSSFTVK